MDSRSVEERSALMARVRLAGNAATELRLIELMREQSISGWRRHQPLLGKPDFTFRRERVLVFVDGCFWHGCPTCFSLPKSNQDYWRSKVARNIARDRKVRAKLRADGWRIVRVWQHQLVKQPNVVTGRLKRALLYGRTL